MSKKTLYIACDHAAFEYKEKIKQILCDTYDFIDLGAQSTDSVHYPDYAHKLAKKILANDDAKGVALCGSGIGISIALNRHKGIRAALCRSAEDAKMSKQHNNANVICFGARQSGIDDIIQMLEIWDSTRFEGGRHQQRVDLIEKSLSEY